MTPHGPAGLPNSPHPSVRRWAKRPCASTTSAPRPFPTSPPNQSSTSKSPSLISTPSPLTATPYKLWATSSAPTTATSRHGSWSEQFALLFRDYLRTHPATAAQYAATKQQLAQQYTHDRVGYTNAKTPIIWRIIQQASQWSQNSGWHPGRSDA